MLPDEIFIHIFATLWLFVVIESRLNSFEIDQWRSQSRAFRDLWSFTHCSKFIKQLAFDWMTPVGREMLIGDVLDKCVCYTHTLMPTVDDLDFARDICDAATDHQHMGF